MTLPLMLPPELPVIEIAALGAMTAIPLTDRSASNVFWFGTGDMVRFPLKVSASVVEAPLAITINPLRLKLPLKVTLLGVSMYMMPWTVSPPLNCGLVLGGM